MLSPDVERRGLIVEIPFEFELRFFGFARQLEVAVQNDAAGGAVLDDDRTGNFIENLEGDQTCRIIIKNYKSTLNLFIMLSLIQWTNFNHSKSMSKLLLDTTIANLYVNSQVSIRFQIVKDEQIYKFDRI